jgi:hypothetical protein
MTYWEATVRICEMIGQKAVKLRRDFLTVAAFYWPGWLEMSDSLRAEAARVLTAIRV